jgi:short-subunit dehydrogenase
MLNDCLRAELHEKNIHVVSVCPGLINTGITTATRFVGVSDLEQQQQRQRAKRIYTKRQLGPNAVAANILNAIQQRHDEVLVGAEAYGLNWLSRIASSLSRRLARMDVAG